VPASPEAGRSPPEFQGPTEFIAFGSPGFDDPSIGCFTIVALFTIVPVARISRLWYYLLTLFFEFAGMYFLIASTVYWLQTGARLGR
jgi:hypothetical protein